MKKIIIIMVLLAIIPSKLQAVDAILGVFFNDRGIFYADPPMSPETFKGYLYIIAPHPVATFQYQLLLGPGHYNPEAVILLNAEYPWNMALTLGDPLEGQAVTYNPQLPCTDNGGSLAITFIFMRFYPCDEMSDYNIVTGPHPTALPHPVYGGMYGLYRNGEGDDIAFDIGSLTSLVCYSFDADESSWGAVKSIYR